MALKTAVVEHLYSKARQKHLIKTTGNCAKAFLL